MDTLVWALEDPNPIYWGPLPQQLDLINGEDTNMKEERFAVLEAVGFRWSIRESRETQVQQPHRKRVGGRSANGPIKGKPRLSKDLER
jgi:hypothetical protein